MSVKSDGSERAGTLSEQRTTSGASEVIDDSMLSCDYI